MAGRQAASCKHIDRRWRLGAHSSSTGMPQREQALEMARSSCQQDNLLHVAKQAEFSIVENITSILTVLGQGDEG